MREHWPFIVILLLISTARFVILVLSQTHVHSDEAIIGLMGKHILEGRCFPFYIYGHPYNAGGAWEAYIAAVLFAAFGVGTVALKSVVVTLSLICLVLFYRMTCSLYDRRTAVVAAVLLAVAPSLLKWHFEVRGYSFYFMSIPVLTAMFFALAGNPQSRMKSFCFGLACGLSVWNLELVLSLVGAFWVLLALLRKLTPGTTAAGAAGFLVGYSPAIFYNLTHDWSNWKTVFAAKAGGGTFDPSMFASIFGSELPKFFGPDTTLWYYAQTRATGWVFYAIALTAVTAALAPLVRNPSKTFRAARDGNLHSDDEGKDLLLFLLALACFVPYVVAPMRVPGYLLGSCFFLSILAARLVVRCAVRPTGIVFSVAILGAAVVTGGVAMIETAGRNEIETLTMDRNERFYLERFAGADIDAVHRHLRDRNINTTWATISFVYPLIFESGETLAVSDRIFGWDTQVYPDSVPRREPVAGDCGVYVLETDSPFRADVERHCTTSAGGAPPLVREYGSLTVIEQWSIR